MRRSNFLRSQIEWADKILAAPNVKYQNGRMSHDVASEVRYDAIEELDDLALDASYTIDANGRLRLAHYNDDI